MYEEALASKREWRHTSICGNPTISSDRWPRWRFWLRGSTVGHAQLTPRELEVLTAMADSATNKAITRRLGISFHTAKFHVAAVLGKLDADTRTEAVMKAAQLGIVML